MHLEPYPTSPSLETFGINWNDPWLVPYKPYGISLAKHIASGTPVHVALNEVLRSNPQISCPVQFVAQSESNGAAAYEQFIFDTQTVPTRDNLHDFFNGLVWLRFPKTKMRLNELQAAAIQASGGVGQHRGSLRDALTLFDENAAFVVERGATSPLLEAIRRKAWRDIFVMQRAAWKDTQVIIFGHALLEKLVTPRKAMTAHVFCPPKALQVLDDAAIATWLDPEHLATKPFAPLPVLGIPGWYAENEDALFYDDVQVFRPHQNSPS